MRQNVYRESRKYVSVSDAINVNNLKRENCRGKVSLHPTLMPLLYDIDYQHYCCEFESLQ